MNLFKKLLGFKNELTLQDYDGWFDLGAKQSRTGVAVTQETALKVSAVYACVRVLAETIGSLPFSIYEKTGNSRKAIDHPLNYLLGVTPNNEQTAAELREFQMTSLGLRGNSYSQKIYNGRGEIAQLNPLKASEMRVDRDSSGKLVFDYQEPGNSRVFSAKEIWRVAGLSTDGVLGRSPVQQARESIGMAYAMEGHGASIFKNGVSAGISLETDSNFTDDQFARLKSQIDENQAGFDNSGKPLLLEGGMKASSIGMNNSDMQFIESRKFQVEDIARWYRVPPHMIGHLDRMTNNNIEHQGMEFAVYSLRPWLVKIEQSISRDLLNDSERGRIFPKFTIEGLLRGDTKTRYEAYGSAIDKGWMNRNEVRELENRQTVEGLDEYNLPVNIETLSERQIRFDEKTSNKHAEQLASNLAKREAQAVVVERKDKQKLVDFYDRFVNVLIDNGISQHDGEEYALQRITSAVNDDMSKFEANGKIELLRILLL